MEEAHKYKKGYTSEKHKERREEGVAKNFKADSRGQRVSFQTGYDTYMVDRIHHISIDGCGRQTSLDLV